MHCITEGFSTRVLLLNFKHLEVMHFSNCLISLNLYYYHVNIAQFNIYFITLTPTETSGRPGQPEK